MARLETVHEVLGPWSLATSKRFWEGFTPGELAQQTQAEGIRTVFLCDTDWQRVDATITQEGASARIVVDGPGDLDAATEQVRRLLSIDIDGRGWPDVAARDDVIADAQRRLPGFRPCGFFSPYEAAAWSVLSQRVQMRQAAATKTRLTTQLGDDGAFPSPETLLGAISRSSRPQTRVPACRRRGRSRRPALRLPPALTRPRPRRSPRCRRILGLGPFAAELVVIRGANFADVLPRNEARLNDEIAKRYGAERSIDEITEAWRPFRSWASVHLRALRGLGA